MWVKLLVDAEHYKAGETVKFPEAIAKNMIARGEAEAAEPPSPEPVPEVHDPDTIHPTLAEALADPSSVVRTHVEPIATQARRRRFARNPHETPEPPK